MKTLASGRNILLVLFLCLIFLYSFNQISNSDTFYDIKTGQYIVQNFNVPTRDIFSLSAAGNLWIPHEWLAQVVFYFVYRISGFLGLIIFAALLAVLTYFILFRLAMQKGADFYLTILLLFLLSYLTLELWVPRPQIFSYLSLAVLIYLLECYRNKPEKKYLFGLVLTIWFWANTNASFILGLVILLFYFFSEAIGSRWRAWSNRGLSSREVNRLGLAALVSILFGIFLAPAGYRGLLYGFYIREVANYLGVLEWKPITLFLYEAQAQLFIAILVLVNAFFAWWFLFRKESRDATLFGLAFGVSLLPFISIRHVGFWPIALFAPAAVSVSGALKNFLARFSNAALGAFVFLIGAIFMLGRLFQMPKSLLDENVIPAKAVDFIQKNNIRGPLFNLYNEGGYLIWRLWPQEKVFIDGRSEVYRGEPIIDFFTVFGSHPGWETLADGKYRFNYFFFDNYTYPLIRKFIEPLTFQLLKKNFRLVYWDDVTIILVRDAPENKRIIKTYGVRSVNPFLEPADIPAKERKAAAEEIKVLLDRFPQSLVVQDYARKFLGSH